MTYKENSPVYDFSAMGDNLRDLDFASQNRICAVIGCDNTYKCKGFCGPHYMKWCRATHPQIYTKIGRGHAKSIAGKHGCLIRTLRKENVPKDDLLWNRDSYAQLLEIGICHYCSKPLDLMGHSLDAKDAKIGHRYYNVVPSCWRCNNIKSDKISYRDMVNIGLILQGLKNEDRTFSHERRIIMPTNAALYKRRCVREHAVSVGVPPALHDLLDRLRVETHQSVRQLCLSLIEEGLIARGENPPPPLPPVRPGPKPGSHNKRTKGVAPAPQTDANASQDGSGAQ